MRRTAWLGCFLLIGTLAFAQQTTGSASGPPRETSSAPAADQPPVHPVTPAQVHELLELTGAGNLKNQLMRGMMVYMRQSFPAYMPKDVVDDLETSLENADMEPMLVAAYQKHLSTEDATEIIAFYKTPAGKRVISSMPLIVQDLQQGGGKLGEDVAHQVFERHKDEIEAAEKQYRQTHPASSSDSPR